MRRLMPWSPRMCIGPKVRLKPMSVSQKCHLPTLSLRIQPNTFGHQK